MSDPIQKPDLDDSINVTETHDRITRQAAAASRENKLGEHGNQPIPLTLLATLGIVLIVTGAVFGNVTNWFSYDKTFREDYVRKATPGVKDSGPQPKTALVAYSAKGAKIYTKCSGCHGPTAQGDGANFPSLAGSEWVKGPTERFAMVVLNGLHGPTSTGKAFGAAGMPAQGGGMTPEDLASILTYVRNNFGNTVGDVVTIDMAKAAIDASVKRAKTGQQVDAEELNSNHKKDLPGDKLDPAILVDPVTLAPTAAK
jgi:mono/diheme cytochrome c family protein